MMLYLCVLSLFFFFQAEDGIRDGTVTGVQTCALPILSSGATSQIGPIAAKAAALLVRRPTGPRSRSIAAKTLVTEARSVMRSEERRVGKECRSRRSRK